MVREFIHRHYLLLKSHYFFFFSSLGVMFPILNLTLRSHGLSNTEISFSNIILPFLVFFISPSIGFLADRFRRYLLTFNITFLIAVITLTSLFFLPSIQSDHIQANLHLVDSSNYVLDFCASQEMATQCSSRSECGCIYQALCRKENIQWKNLTFSMTSSHLQKEFNDYQLSQCGITYRIPIENNISLVEEDQHARIQCEITCSIAHFCHGIRRPKQLIYILLHSFLYIIGASLLSTSNAIGASIGFASLSHGHLFGKQRVWGTIGFGILAFVTSLIYERFHSEYVYVIIFGVIAFLTFLVTSCLRISSEKRTADKRRDSFHPSTLVSLLNNVDVLVFLSITFVWGMCFGSLQPYVFLYIDEIAPCQSRSVIGYMSLIAAISEVIAFLIASQVIRFFGMNFSSILIFLAFAVRFFGYYFIQKPYFFLPLEITHFFNYGILYVLIVQKADTIAPAGMASTLQGVAHGVTHGLGRGIGMLVASFIYIVIEQRLLFLVCALFNLFAALIYSIYFFFTRNKTTDVNLSNTRTDIDLPLNEQALTSTNDSNNNNNNEQ